MSILEYIKEDLYLEMPHGVVNHHDVDFKLEKDDWNIQLIKFIKQSNNIDELLKPFYNMQYLKLFAKKYNELDSNDQKDLSQLLPIKFKKDVGII
jgi:hypothetical protein